MREIVGSAWKVTAAVWSTLFFVAIVGSFGTWHLHLDTSRTILDQHGGNPPHQSPPHQGDNILQQIGKDALNLWGAWDGLFEDATKSPKPISSRASRSAGAITHSTTAHGIQDTSNTRSEAQEEALEEATKLQARIKLWRRRQARLDARIQQARRDALLRQARRRARRVAADQRPPQGQAREWRAHVPPRATALSHGVGAADGSPQAFFDQYIRPAITGDSATPAASSTHHGAAAETAGTSTGAPAFVFPPGFPAQPSAAAAAPVRSRPAAGAAVTAGGVRIPGDAVAAAAATLEGQLARAKAGLGTARQELVRTRRALAPLSAASNSPGGGDGSGAAAQGSASRAGPRAAQHLAAGQPDYRAGPGWGERGRTGAAAEQAAAASAGGLSQAEQRVAAALLRRMAGSGGGSTTPSAMSRSIPPPAQQEVSGGGGGTAGAASVAGDEGDRSDGGQTELAGQLAEMRLGCGSATQLQSCLLYLHRCMAPFRMGDSESCRCFQGTGSGACVPQCTEAVYRVYRGQVAAETGRVMTCQLKASILQRLREFAQMAEP